MNFGLRHDPALVMVTATLTEEQSLDDARKALTEALADVVKNPPLRRTSIRSANACSRDSRTA